MFIAQHRIATAVLATGFALVAAACSSSSKSTSSASVSSGPTTTAAAASTNPGTSFSTGMVAGVGDVVVDGVGRTVYVLSADGKTNLPCTDASGCTKYWPDLPLPTGTSSAQAGTGLQGSLLGTKTESDGQTYATYNGWLMYEFANDANGQAKGQGVHSFGGTWWALSPSGTPVTTMASTSTTVATTAASSGGYGY